MNWTPYKKGRKLFAPQEDIHSIYEVVHQQPRRNQALHFDYNNITYMAMWC